MEADFSGYATKANLKCSDGLTITPDAFKHQDTTKVPLVWQHSHNDPKNVLGYALLEHREDGTYAHGFFNDTESGVSAKKLVVHGDVNALSIYANQLIKKSKAVLHGVIREVSLVLAGANPGAVIDYVNVVHSNDEVETLDDEAVIYTGLPLDLKHSDESADVEETPEPDESDEDNKEEKGMEDEVVLHAGTTVQDVFNTLDERQKNVVFFMIGEALKGPKDASAEHADSGVKETFESFDDAQKDVALFMIGEALKHAEQTTAADAETVNEDDKPADADNKEGSSMTHNVFESDADDKAKTGTKLSHADQAKIFKSAVKLGSLKDAVEAYATDELKHGIEDIDILFPDAKAVTSTPDFIKRRTEWVAQVMTGTRHTPFSRIKSMTANLTLEEARAKGYIKGNLKKEEFFRVAKRVTTPQTIYKKQQLDRDDILDITDFDVVAWLKGEMRLMLEEELARAVLVGDGRSAGDDDKISEDHIRPIATDNDLYVTRLYVNLGDTDSSADEIIDALTLQRRHYRGSGNPTLYLGETVLAQLLLIKDTLGRRIYTTTADLQAALRVSNIVTVEVMDEPTSSVVGIVVNLQDYTIGADRGGDVALFDDFDIDYNQYKYLIETRCSGALVRAKSALVLFKTASNSVLVDPVAPTFDDEDHTVTVATTTGIVYKNRDTNATLTTGSPVTLSEGEELVVIAVPATGYHLSSTAADEFLFDYERGRVDAAF